MNEWGDGRFPTTRWSLVLAAGRDVTTGSRESLESLCEAYWYPIYVRIRRTEKNPENARDLTQGFFFEVLHNRSLQVADPDRGRFRCFMTVLLKNYLSNERRNAQALKRGGGTVPISFDFEGAESRYRLEASDEDSPERMFERAWAQNILSRTMERLRADQDGERFRRLEQFITGAPADTSYRRIGADLGMTEAAVKTAIHRLRKRFGELLRLEVGETVQDSRLVDGEIRHLLHILSD